MHFTLTLPPQPLVALPLVVLVLYVPPPPQHPEFSLDSFDHAVSVGQLFDPTGRRSTGRLTSMFLHRSEFPALELQPRLCRLDFSLHA